MNKGICGQWNLSIYVKERNRKVGIINCFEFEQLADALVPLQKIDL